MNKLSEFSHVLLAVYRQAQTQGGHGFQGQVLRDVQALLPFDSAVWGTATMRPSGLDVHSIYLHNSSQAMLDAYGHVKHLDTAAQRVRQQARTTYSFDIDTEFASPATQPMHAFCTRFGHHHGLISSDLNLATQFFHWISLFRANPNHPFTQADIDTQALLAPHLMQALSTHRLAYLDRLRGDVAREHWSVGLVDARGVVYYADPVFSQLVQREWPDSCAQQLPYRLVEQLAVGISRILGKSLLLECTLQNDLLFLRARPRHAVDDLTARELVVARLLSEGFTHKQVATQLGRSPETIHSQAKTVLDKLKVSSVVMLAPLLALLG